jgi:hypothetical protein
MDVKMGYMINLCLSNKGFQKIGQKKMFFFCIGWQH